MSKIYITFKPDQEHSINGKDFCKNCVAVIECVDLAEGKEKAFKYFGDEYLYGDFNTLRYNNDDIYDIFPRGLIEVEQEQKLITDTPIDDMTQEQLKHNLKTIVSYMDGLDVDDFFGPEGWREHITWDVKWIKKEDK
jgi:hypothetical protein